eukprot:768240-Hanusia_phi.AAC.6
MLQSYKYFWHRRQTIIDGFSLPAHLEDVAQVTEVKNTWTQRGGKSRRGKKRGKRSEERGERSEAGGEGRGEERRGRREGKKRHVSRPRRLSKGLKGGEWMNGSDVSSQYHFRKILGQQEHRVVSHDKAGLSVLT